jgi:hypothetical protein
MKKALWCCSSFVGFLIVWFVASNPEAKEWFARIVIRKGMTINQVETLLGKENNGYNVGRWGCAYVGHWYRLGGQLTVIFHNGQVSQVHFRKLRTNP